MNGSGVEEVESSLVLGHAKLVENDLQQEKSRTLGVRVWEIFGFGTQYLWLFSIMFGSAFFSLSGDVEWARFVKAVFALGFAVVYLVFFALKNVVDFGSMGRVSIILLGVVGSLGTMLVVFPSSGVLRIYIAFVASVLVGISQASLMSLGNRAWSKMRPERVMVHLAGSALVACALYFLLSCIPDVVSTVVVCLLPVVGGVILSTTKKESLRARPLRKLDLNDGCLYLKILAFVAAFSFPMGVVVGSATCGDAASFSYGSFVLVVGALCVASFAFVLALRAAPTGMLKILGSVGVPLIVAGCVFALAFWDEAFLFGGALVVAGFVAADLFMWFLNAELVSRSGCRPLEVLARSCCVEWASFFIGFVFASGFFGDAAEFGIGRFLYALSAIVLVVVSSFVLTQVDLVRIVEAREGVQDKQGIEDACRSMAERFGLSARETEVMVYLANGRTVPYIQDKLTISQSTVKTHVRNIYRKMGVKGKQELLDVIEKEIF